MEKEDDNIDEWTQKLAKVQALGMSNVLVEICTGQIREQ